MIVMCLGDTIEDNVIYTRKGKLCRLTPATFRRMQDLEDSGILVRPLPCKFYGKVLFSFYAAKNGE